MPRRLGEKDARAIAGSGGHSTRLYKRLSPLPRSWPVSNVTGFNIFSVSGFKRCDGGHRQRGQNRIIYLTVELRNRSKDGGRYAQDHYRNGDRCDCDGHYCVGSVATGRHNQSAGRRQPRADARASPVVKSRTSSTLIDKGCGPAHSPPWWDVQGRRGPRSSQTTGPYIFGLTLANWDWMRACMRGPALESNVTRKEPDRVLPARDHWASWKP